MELIEKLTNELDVEINRVWGEYIDLHKELDSYRGTPIGENLDRVNNLLKEIQDKFGMLYPAYHFIATRHQYVNNAVNGYNDFIETLKKGGAVEHKPEATIITPGGDGKMSNVS